jgi:hypothetical protein
MSATPNYAAAPRASSFLVSTANSGRDGTGTLATVFTAGASGSRIDFLIIQSIAAATTAGMIRLFIHNGTAAFLFKEVPVPVNTASASVEAFNTVVTFDGGLTIPSGFSLRASTQVAESFHLTAFGGDF